MRTDREELIILRESLTRVARALGLAEHVPGTTPSSSYAEIHKAASNIDRGWNALCARMVDRAHHLSSVEPQTEPELHVCACGRVLDMCGECAEEFELQALKHDPYP